MSAPALPVDQRDPLDSPAAPAKPRVAAGISPLDVLDAIMRPIASLKLTVVLFALAIWVVLVGTLAQTEADIWQVVRDYFHAWIMWVDVNLLFPKSFFPDMPKIDLPLIPSPGGMLVGVLMAINLLAAHAWRFKIQSSGTRLLVGLAVIALGILLTVLVILSGHNDAGFQSRPPFSYPQLWIGLVWLTLASVLCGCVALYQYGIRPATEQASLTWVRILVLAAQGGLLVLVGGVLLAALKNGWYPGDEALRVLWQMVQGGLAGIVLLVGCILVFRKRGGIVLLHAGIGLMMVNELLVARQAVEWQITLDEGQTRNYLQDIRTTELAIIDRSGKETDEHVVIPRDVLIANYNENQKLAKNNKPPVSIQSDLLPFDVAVLTYYRNADVKPRKSNDKTPADKQRGLTEMLVDLPIAKGTDMGGGVDIAGAYVKLTAKDGRDLGTYMLSQFATIQKNPDKFAETVEAGDKKYDLFLRFKRSYRPYTVTLKDVRKDDYVASDTPRNYSSDIALVDKAAGVDQPVHIKMNDPLRYRGETFYQSGYTPPNLNGGVEGTTLQVVRNRIWMIPYVSCMIVVIGLVAQFLTTAVRFIGRRESEELASGDVIRAGLADDFAPRKASKKAMSSGGFNWSFVGLPVLVAGIFVLWVGSSFRTPQVKSGEMDIARFGGLPVAHMGRIKPIDTLARNSLQAISNRDYVKLEDGKKLSATQWLLDLITGAKASDNYRVIRIDHPETLKLFELEQRPGSFRYSVNEIRPQMERFLRQVEAASKLRPDELNNDQRKLIELEGRLKEYMMLVESFKHPRYDLPTQEDIEKNPDLAKQKIENFRMEVFQTTEQMKQIKAPRVIPLDMPEGMSDEEHWVAYPNAATMNFMKMTVMGEEGEPITLAFNGILAGYARSNATEFNSELARYEALLNKAKPPLLNRDKVAFEEDFNRAAPFRLGMYAYFLAFLIAIFGWLTRWQPLNWTAFTLIVLTLLLHTAALWARIYISGRPPVTNLYSTAIFIGWGAVIFGVVVEAIFRFGLGNIIASVAGYATLLISVLLALDGDTITVMQAVLDTQFWLATHVVCITLGYSATFVAGLLGLLYLILGISTPNLDEAARKDIGRMIYGVLCFALLLSFFGTVLGGLWADDSWGRFWGWDPKENGALIIVLWNALVLHARWDKMIADRGLAVLSLGGNIVTAWSWFGVNALGIGLHSYGFKEGMLLALFTFFAYMAVCVLFGSLLPRRLWWSSTATGSDTTVPFSVGMTFLATNVAFVLSLGWLAYVVLV